jgi:hypothetical protein
VSAGQAAGIHCGLSRSCVGAVTRQGNCRIRRWERITTPPVVKYIIALIVYIIFVIGSGFEALADLAPGLTGVELKVLIELSRRQLRGKSGAGISSRELAKACRIGRSNVVMAIDSLTNKNHIYMRQGTPTTPASYHGLCPPAPAAR